MEKSTTAARPSLVPTLALLLLAIFFALYRIAANRLGLSSYWVGAFFLLPPLCFWAAALWSICKPAQQASVRLLLLLFAACLLWDVGAACGIVWNFSSAGSTDAARYQGTLQAVRFSDQDALSFFPKQIPADASEVSFLYQPRLGQGSKELALAFTCAPETLSAFADELAGRAKWQGAFSDPNAQTYGVFRGSLSAVLPDDLPLDEAELYVMHYRPNGAADWNHGEHALSAVFPASGKIVFLAEQW